MEPAAGVKGAEFNPTDLAAATSKSSQLGYVITTRKRRLLTFSLHRIAVASSSQSTLGGGVKRTYKMRQNYRLLIRLRQRNVSTHRVIVAYNWPSMVR